MARARRTIAVCAITILCLSVMAVPASAAKRRCFGKVATIVAKRGADRINGTRGADVIVGSNRSEEIRGGAGRDLICGRGGDDLIFAGPGSDKVDAGSDFGFSDTVWGGPGSDFLKAGGAADPATGIDMFDLVGYADSSRGVEVDLVSGRATGEGNDRLVGFEQAEGSQFDDRLLGPDVVEGGLLIGLGGNDFIQLGQGDFSGALPGEGNDEVRGVEGARMAIAYDDVAGPVTVDIGAGTASGAGNDTFTGFKDAFGTPANDLLVGDEGSNHLFGLGGEDELRAEGNAETLDDPYSFPDLPDGDLLLGDGHGDTPANDLLVGGEGVAVACYCGAPSGVTVDLGTGQATGGGGSDTLVDINAVIGSDYDDTLRGSAADEMFEGSAGSDSIDGLGGRDAFVAFHSEGLTADLDAGTASSNFPGFINGEFGLFPASASLSNIEDLWGSLDWTDTLTGDDSANRIYGMGGNDTMRGLEGNDLLDGGDGVDTADGGTGTDRCLATETPTSCESSMVRHRVTAGTSSGLRATGWMLQRRR